MKTKKFFTIIISNSKDIEKDFKDFINILKENIKENPNAGFTLTIKEEITDLN